jgi:hypothetical protein
MMAKEVQMTHDQREIHRKKRILEYAERIGNIKEEIAELGDSDNGLRLQRYRY